MGVGADHGRLPGPVAAKGRVEDQLHVVEVAVDRAPFPALEVSRRRAPLGRVRIGAGDVRGRLAFGPGPDVDVVRRPLGSEDTATGGIKAVAVGGRGGGGVERAAFVGEAGVAAEGAAVGGVHGHDVAGLVVDAFEDVDLTVGGPCGGAEHPERGPDAAGVTGHVGEVEDDEGVLVGLGGGNADAFTTSA